MIKAILGVIFGLTLLTTPVMAQTQPSFEYKPMNLYIVIKMADKYDFITFPDTYHNRTECVQAAQDFVLHYVDPKYSTVKFNGGNEVKYIRYFCAAEGKPT